MRAPAASLSPGSRQIRALTLCLALCGGVAGCDALVAAGGPDSQALSLDSHTPGVGYEDAWGVGDIQHWNAGSGWVRVVSDGESNPSLVQSPRLEAPLDLRGRFLHIWLRIDRLDRLQGLELRVFSGDSQDDFFAFTVPLYDDPEFNLLQPGQWVPFTFNFAAARPVGQPDRAAVDGLGLYVEDRGAGPVTLDWAGARALPQAEQGVLSFTFDDGYASHAQIAAPSMADYGFPGTAYVMPREIGTSGYMTVSEAKALQHRFGWDVAAHHALPFTGMTTSQLEGEIAHIQSFLTGHDLGDGFQHLAYPLGKHDPVRVLGMVRESFATARIAGGGAETLPPADPHRLRVFNVKPDVSPAALGAAARRARDNGEWLILMFHHLVDEPASPLDYGVTEFSQAVAEIAKTGIPVRTVAEVWREQLAEHTLLVEPGQLRSEPWFAGLRDRGARELAERF